MEEPIGEYCCPVQIIDSDGHFKNAGLDRFVEQVKLGECGASYVVTSIIGAQSSGKSTLMNHLFGTRFTEMDINKRRCQTTKGIWIAKCAGIEPCTLAMDVEGTDGRERGEDDTFERQSALFALAISDIVLINMWCHDLGREHAANKPLLRTIFEVNVMMHSFDPARKTTLIFILRDKTKSSLELLQLDLKDDIRRIWNAVPKSRDHESTLLDEIFSVEVVALSSYEDKEKEFQEEVAQLKKRFINSTSPGGLAGGDRTGVLPASEFSHYAQEIWTQIKKNKDLDIASHKKSIAAFRCEEIANEKFMQLSFDENWLALETTVQTDLVRDFGGKFSSILNIYISGYDKETEYFDELIRNSKRHQLLVTKALDLIRPAYAIMLRHLRSEALENFKIRLVRSLVRLEGFVSSVIAHTESCMREFDQACADASIDAAINSNGNAYGVLEEKSKRELKRDIEAYASSQVDEQLSRLKLDCERQLLEALSLNDPIAALLLEGDDDIWSKKRGLLHDAIELVDERFSNEFNGYALDQGRSAEMLQIVRDYARRVAEEKPRQEATRVLTHMVNRFLQAFNYDSDANARTWTVEVDIRIIIRNARYESLKILSTLAAIRLDETQDDIERVLSSTLIDGEISSTTLDSVNWDMVSSNDTLITPLECQSLWRQFKEETTHAVVQAYATQVIHRRNNAPNDVPNDDAPNDPEFKPYIWIIAVIIVLLSAYGIPNAASFVPEILGLLLPRLRSQVLTFSAIFIAVQKFAEAYRNWRSQK